MIKTVLFWNFNIERGDSLRKLPTEAERSAVIARLAGEYEVDVLAIAECQIPDVLLLDALRQVDPAFDQPAVPHRRFRFFTRFPGDSLRSWHADDRLAVCRLCLGDCEDILLAAFHYLDRRNYSLAKQHQRLAGYKRTLREAERKAGHDRLIVFGDFNMNPYEIGMLDPASGLGAMMTRELAEFHGDGKKDDHSRFYNPMWSIMGRAETPGTFYWDHDDPENPYWHCLDGVLLRPSLRQSFRDEDLRVIRWITGPDGERIDLIRRADVHWKLAYSDHLPILFKLRLWERKPAEGEDGHA